MPSRTALLHDYLGARDGKFPAPMGDLARLEADVLVANDGLVRMVAARYRSRRSEPDLFDDLVQEGRIGLLTALRLYQDDGRATLATYAIYRIRERIGRWIYEQTSPLRINATTQRQARRRDEERGALGPSLPRAVWLSAVRDADDRPFDLVSNALGPEALLVSRETRAALGLAVAALPARERDLLIRHFGLDGGPRVRQVVLAAELGISRQRVHQILGATTRRLRAQPDIAALGPSTQPPVRPAAPTITAAARRPRVRRQRPSGPCPTESEPVRIGAMTSATDSGIDMRSRLAALAIEWECRYGVAPPITSAISEYDAAMLVGLTDAEYVSACVGRSAVTPGADFVHKGIRYQVKANRPSGRAGSTVTIISKPRNLGFDVLVWVLYRPDFSFDEVWTIDVAMFERELHGETYLRPARLRAVGTRLYPGGIG